VGLQAAFAIPKIVAFAVTRRAADAPPGSCMIDLSEGAPVPGQTLLQQIAAGDRDAVARCLDAYGSLVWSLARRFTSSRDDAEDAVQEIFIELWAHAARFDPAKASETTFVAMLARRRLIDRLRKTRREPPTEGLDALSAMPDPAERSSADELEVREEAARAQRLIGELKPDQQLVIRLAVFQGLTHQGIAEQLGLPLGTVKTHLRRGLLRLREGLRSNRGDAPGGGAP